MSNGLDVVLMKDPSGAWDPEQGDCHTDIAFSDPEWGSFFFNTLGAELTPYFEGEPIEQYGGQRRLTFQKSLAEYPLLSRIDQFYKDALFASNEIPLLEFELKLAESLSMDADAKAFLSGMRSACEMALSKKMGIRLLSS